MRIDRSLQISLGLALSAAIFVGCSGGGSQVTPAGSNTSAVQRGTYSGTAAQSLFQQALQPNVTYTQQAQSYALTASGETITFPSDGDATGSSDVPGVTTTPLPTLNLCENDVPISGTTGGCVTAASASDSSCTEAANTFWYSTLELTGGPTENHFASSDIPVTFTSPNLIPKKSKLKYGLCVVALGIVVQDDFKKKDGEKPVKQKKSTINVELIIPSALGGDFPTGSTASIFFEHS